MFTVRHRDQDGTETIFTATKVEAVLWTPSLAKREYFDVTITLRNNRKVKFTKRNGTIRVYNGCEIAHYQLGDPSTELGKGN